jgi:histidinol phosphatase-like PHP family hydrolase
MLSAYEKKGFTEVGISNHCICHPSVDTETHSQFFNDVDKFLDVCKASFDYIDEASSKHKIKVYKGLEVDYFPSAQWNRIFERIVREIKPDYMIGATHFIRTADESSLYNIHFLNKISGISDEAKNELLRNYWKM